MTENEAQGGWPVLPPPDLSETYAQLPQTWRIGAVLLADRILAAAYRQDVLEVAARIAHDAQAGAVRGQTLYEYLVEATEAHPRVVDANKALQVLQYSPRAQQGTAHFGDLLVHVGLQKWVAQLFRRDVEDALRNLGLEVDDDSPPDDGEEPLMPGDRNHVQ